jgi:RNA polymerase sigma factor (sigma-70 family)
MSQRSTLAMQISTSNNQLQLKKLSQGDCTAFWQLWMPHQDYLYHCCLTWMDGNVIDAQDAFSYTILKAWDKLPHHAEKITNLKAWLTRFTHNLCMDIHREHGRKAIGVDTIEEIAGHIEVERFSVNSPESTILSSEMEITIRCAIEALPPRLRLPFNMRFEQDMSYPDIARKLGISIDNVYKRISQARSVLKPRLNKYLSEEDNSDLSEITPPSIERDKTTEANLNKGIQQGLQPILLIQLESSGEVLEDRGIKCLYCQSTHISKNGHRRGKQNFLCQICDRQFIDSYSSKGYTPEIRERCFKLYASGMGYRAIRRETGVSHSTVKNWVRQETTS